MSQTNGLRDHVNGAGMMPRYNARAVRCCAGGGGERDRSAAAHDRRAARLSRCEPNAACSGGNCNICSRIVLAMIDETRQPGAEGEARVQDQFGSLQRAGGTLSETERPGQAENSTQLSVMVSGASRAFLALAGQAPLAAQGLPASPPSPAPASTTLRALVAATLDIAARIRRSRGL